uniref:hypothetical protein n=1 Tax=Holdemanella biformis TaxID=1735 RepID=UPI00265FBA69|nr:hypothetical protein [Holdemanella biformis]
MIYYEYFVSFSGFVKDEPCITFWTLEGKVYYLNISELRDGRFERVIPFFESMANQEKIDQGDLFYFNWRLIPKGWKCYQEPGLHCFMPKAVYKDFRSRYERMKNEKPKEDVEYIISIFNRWKIALKQSYQEIYGWKINEDETTYIRLDERIHVYCESYVEKNLDIKNLSGDVIHKIKEAAVWEIEYVPASDGFRNCIQIILFFEQDEPFVLTYDFQIKERSDYMAEDEFMSCFKKTFKCDIGNHENGIDFDNPIKGYHLFKQKNVFWIRDDLYQNNYKNVIEPFIHYSENKRFLQSIICGCVENKNLDKEEKE